MPSLRVLIERGDVCRSLREKRLFYQSPGEETDAANAGPFWCEKTQSLIGPDDRIADHADCRAGRSCFKAV